ncbi:PepSY domain-containing protein [Psychromonas sp.]|nr:PepSY domain-containing protein [Psychromonas sp.]
MKFPKLIGMTLAFTSLSVLAGNDNALSALALKQANYSLEQAVEKVQNNYKGQIIEFELEDDNNQLSYEIEVIDVITKEKHKLELSLEDGSVLKEKSKSIGIKRLDDDELAALTDLQASDFNLNKIIALLKEQYKADILEFELENEKGITFYKFKLFSEQGTQQVLVDVKTGSMISVMKK